MPKALRILILEDNYADAELVRFELAEAGFVFTPKVVMTETDFIREIREFCPDLILSDYDLPRYNGAQALAEARERCPDTPFILVTGAVSEDRAIEILTQGAKDYVLKARLEQRLVPAVRRALAEAEEQRERRKAQDELREAHRTLEERVRIRTAELEAEIARRRKTEEALRESEFRERLRAEELATILDSVPTPVIIVHDPNAHHMTGNRSADELLRHPHGTEVSLSAPDDVKPRHFRAMKDGHQLRLDELPAQRAARGEQVKDFEFELVFDDGGTLQVLGYGTPLLNDRGEPRGAVHVLVDLTAHRHAEQKLRLSEERYRKLFNGMNEGFSINEIITDEGGTPVDCRFLEVNPAFERLTGLKPEQVTGRTFHEVLPGEDPEWVRKFGSVALTGEPVQFEKYSTILRRFYQILAYRPAPGQFAVIFMDITERKEGEEKLRASEESFRALVTASSEVLYRMSPDWGEMRLLHSRGFLANTEEPNPLWLQEYILPDDQPCVQAAIAEAIRTKGVFQLEHRVVRADGTPGWTFSRAIPLLDGNGEIIEWFGSASDITARKEAEEAKP